MEQRGQFTFYRSFWEAVKALPKKDRLPIYEAIVEYALDGTVPAGLTQSQAAFFLLVKPNLDASRKKAENGKQGGSKTKAKGKQTQSEKENEIEKENENEIEIEGEKEKKQTSPVIDSLFDEFLSAYPNQIAGDLAKVAWDSLNLTEESARQVLVSLDSWKRSDAWKEKGGKFIPRAAKFLTDGYWKCTPASDTGASGRQLDEYEIAAIHRMMREGGCDE